MSILGLDIGTTGVKAVVFRDDGEQLTSAYREYNLVSPRPGWLELDPDAVLDAVREVVGRVAAQSHADPIRSLATATLGESAVPVDAAHRPVGNAIVGFDSRGDTQAAAFRALVRDEDVFAITGHSVQSAYTLFKILWRREHDPNVFRTARKFLCFGDFVLASLGVPPRIDYSMAARTMAFDVHRLAWSEEILGAAGLSPDLFAPPAAPGEPIGEIGRNDLGLSPRCVVAAGLHDQPAGMLGSGVRPGESMLATGTVICLGVHLRQAPAAAVMVPSNLCAYPTYGKGQFVSIAYNFTGGSLLKWYRDTLGGDEVTEARLRDADPYDVITEGLPEAPTGLLVLPHFAATGTPWLDPNALGAVFGLRLTTRRKEIVKAILEGIVYEVRLNSDLLAQAGVEIEAYRAIGGAARSTTWMQIAADILDRPVLILDVCEGAALGAALLGARASGILRSDAAMDEVVARRATVRRTLTPRRQAAERYAERFSIYRDLYPSTRGISHRLSKLGG